MEQLQISKDDVDALIIGVFEKFQCHMRASQLSKTIFLLWKKDVSAAQVAFHANHLPMDEITRTGVKKYKLKNGDHEKI